jgi:hypothetical protein
MKTEIERIKEAVKVYEGYYWRSQKEWLEAEKYLLKVHDQYGTIDTATIKELTR